MPIARVLLLSILLASSARADEAIAWSAPVPSAGGKGMIALAGGRLLIPATEHADGRTRLCVYESRDFGRTSARIGTVAESPSSRADLGDAALMQDRDGRVWISYRDNDGSVPRYAIKAATSDDGGRTWAAPTTVAESRPPKVSRFSRGLWASCLFQRRDGTVLCLYDDEESPTVAGFPGHQWITAKTFDARQEAWIDATTITRANDAKLLSRDGMMSVVETKPGELLVAFESVETQPPHANVIRSVRSVDNGRSWSWQTGERDVIYRAAKPNRLAFAPWMVALPDGRLICVFCTDEDRDRVTASGTAPPAMRADVKAILSGDGGRTWGASVPVAAESHRTYLPGVAARAKGDGGIELFVGYLDYAAGGFRGVTATIPAAAEP